MEDKYVFILKRDKPFFINLMGGMLMLFAILFFLNSPLASLVMAIASIGFFTFQSGIEIDFTEHQYREISIVGPQVFGTWLPLPELDYVSLFKVGLVHSVTGRSGVTVSDKTSVLQVNLVTTANNKIKVFETEDPEEAIQKAKEFASRYKLEIWDASQRPADWLKESPVSDVNS